MKSSCYTENVRDKQDNLQAGEQYVGPFEGRDEDQHVTDVTVLCVILSQM